MMTSGLIIGNGDGMHLAICWNPGTKLDPFGLKGFTLGNQQITFRLLEGESQRPHARHLPPECWKGDDMVYSQSLQGELQSQFHPLFWNIVQTIAPHE